ncbi:MAG: ABC transporter permease [Bryobacterales bacterium]|nr:ABC transporter permease [Bryobacterales bacterium]
MREILEQVWASLTRNKLRSLLTMAGIAWGVASIVLIVAMGEGFRQGQRKSTRQLGENLVVVFPGRTELQAGGQRAGRVTRPTYRDVEQIRSECWLVLHVCAELRNNVTARSAYNSGSFETHGVEPNYNRIRTIPIEAGRFLNQEDETERRRVCVIGSNVRKQLFGDRTGALGSEIHLNGLPYQIVGLMEEKQQNSSYSGLDVDKVLVPYSTLARDFPPVQTWYEPGLLNNMVYAPRSLDDWDGAQRQVRQLMGRNHGYDAADKSATPMWDTVENARLIDDIFSSMNTFLGTVAFVTLVLGGVGVMNIMLVSVTERTREIGIRKAMGATRRRILFDFFLEGMLLAMASGSAGWLASWSLAAAVNSFPMPAMFSGLLVSPGATLLAFSALVAVSVASALWPAWRAASLTPVEALRYER